MSATFTRDEIERMGFTITDDGKAVRKGELQPEAPKERLLGRFKSSWEVLYAQRLATLAITGAIDSWGYETIKLRLADNTYWTPDFAVVVHGKLEIREIKGHWRPQARVKVKVAAETFPWLPIFVIRYEKGAFHTIETFNV